MKFELPNIAKLQVPNVAPAASQAKMKVPDLGLVPSRKEDAELINNNMKTLEQTAFQQRAKKEAARMELVTDSEFWVCFCFETREQKDEFLLKTGLDVLGDKHISGLDAADIIGLELESPSPEWPKTRSFSSYGETLKPGARK